MNVHELISRLSELDPEAIVLLRVEEDGGQLETINTSGDGMYWKSDAPHETYELDNYVYLGGYA